MKTDNALFQEFHSWIVSQKDEAYEIVEKDPDSIDFVTDKATAHVTFYHLEEEIVQFTIDSPQAEDPLFFLHFELADLSHAKQLFKEMIQSLMKARNAKSLHILLSCSSGFTTSFFAEKLNEAAAAKNYDWDFSAVAYTELFEAAQDKQAVLLAPQIGYLLKKAKEVFSSKYVAQIPTQIFAKYDANALLEMIKEDMHTLENTPEEAMEDIADPEWDSTIATIAIARRNGKFVIQYKTIALESVVSHGTVIKDSYDIADIQDLVNVLLIKTPGIKGIAIVSPGTVANGYLDFPNAKIKHYDIVGEFTKKYHIPFVLCNDANALAMGYYANHRDCGNLLAYCHPIGAGAGGAGMILNGILNIGKNDFAGECSNYQRLLNFSDDRFDLARTPEGIVEVVAKTLVPMICSIGPDTVVISCSLVTDIGEIREMLRKYIPDPYMPNIVLASKKKYEAFYGGGIAIYNYLHGHTENYRPELKKYWK